VTGCTTCPARRRAYPSQTNWTVYGEGRVPANQVDRTAAQGRTGGTPPGLTLNAEKIARKRGPIGRKKEKKRELGQGQITGRKKLTSTQEHDNHQSGQISRQLALKEKTTTSRGARDSAESFPTVQAPPVGPGGGGAGFTWSTMEKLGIKRHGQTRTGKSGFPHNPTGEVALLRGTGVML